MVLYNCNHCLFSSTIKTHYNRHLKTTKHLKNLKKFSEKSIKVYKTEPQMTTKHQFLTTNDHKRPQKYTKNLDKLKSQNGVKIYTCQLLMMHLWIIELEELKFQLKEKQLFKN